MSVTRFGRRAAKRNRAGSSLPCQPANGYEVFTRDRCATRSWLRQRIHWEPQTRLIRIIAVQRRADFCLPVAECVTERAYSPREIGKWLVEAGFNIRGVHDAQTLRIAAGCPPRVIIIAQKAISGRSL